VFVNGKPKNDTGGGIGKATGEATRGISHKNPLQENRKKLKRGARRPRAEEKNGGGGKGSKKKGGNAGSYLHKAKINKIDKRALLPKRKRKISGKEVPQKDGVDAASYTCGEGGFKKKGKLGLKRGRGKNKNSKTHTGEGYILGEPRKKNRTAHRFKGITQLNSEGNSRGEMKNPLSRPRKKKNKARPED